MFCVTNDSVFDSNILIIRICLYMVLMNFMWIFMGISLQHMGALLGFKTCNTDDVNGNKALINKNYFYAAVCVVLGLSFVKIRRRSP